MSTHIPLHSPLAHKPLKGGTKFGKGTSSIGLSSSSNSWIISLQEAIKHVVEGYNHSEYYRFDGVDRFVSIQPNLHTHFQMFLACRRLKFPLDEKTSL